MLHALPEPKGFRRRATTAKCLRIKRSHSDAGASNAQRGSGNSDASSPAQRMNNQGKFQTQQQQPADASPFEHSCSGRVNSRMRLRSLDEPMTAVKAAAPTPVAQRWPAERVASPRLPECGDTGSTVYTACELRSYVTEVPRPCLAGIYQIFWQRGVSRSRCGLQSRLGTAQQMCGGDWPDDFSILVLNGNLDGIALVYFERMLPLWTAESPTLEHVMNRMLIPYMTRISAVMGGLQLMTFEKLKDRTWTDRYQYLTYVTERSESMKVGTSESTKCDVDTSEFAAGGLPTSSYRQEPVVKVVAAISEGVEAPKADKQSGQSHVSEAKRPVRVSIATSWRSSERLPKQRQMWWSGSAKISLRQVSIATSAQTPTNGGGPPMIRDLAVCSIYLVYPSVGGLRSSR
ncbi:hypothetical protein P3T76_013241 [Phytophthora citrophthora]|uniref:Uncharacterized protein n=1 Tax=Phytophthora citrophthora TaxID=4793 RepID=A0AAD9G4G0_9STRA|nr:hypothetical protein P3T76_013241 [Phytophthora citrophthora]